MSRKYLTWFILYVILLTSILVIGFQNDAEAGGKCSTRCWYLKYHAEKRQVKRLKVQLKSVRRGRNQLQREIIPWVNLSICESGGRWGISTGNGFYGGIQFHPRTWRSFGGTTFSSSAHRATPVQQVAIAQKVLKVQGRNAWPGCTRKGAW